jgi:hypothetical protein
MLWTVKDTSRFLEMEPHQVYYMLIMGSIEAFKISRVWRIMPDSVKAYKAKLTA